MKANISIGECIIRIVVGVLFASIVVGIFSGYVALLGLLAIYPIVTGLGGWDPIYSMLGKYTNEDSPYEDHEHTASTQAPVSRSRSKVNSAA